MQHKEEESGISLESQQNNCFNCKKYTKSLIGKTYHTVQVIGKSIFAPKVLCKYILIVCVKDMKCVSVK